MRKPLTPEQLRERRRRQDLEATYPKCFCGATAGLGQTRCGAHRDAEDQTRKLRQHQVHRMIQQIEDEATRIAMVNLLDLVERMK